MGRMFFMTMAMLLLVACDKREQMAKLAETNIRQSVEYPEHLKIMGISEPDSAFGTSYFTQKEIQGMMTVMRKVSEDIMRRTRNMTEFNPDDHYVIDMAERQMRAMTEIRSMVRQANGKGKWSGWKIKVDYQARNRHGLDYRAERWLFLDKEGKTVFKTFELPLP